MTNDMAELLAFQLNETGKADFRAYSLTLGVHPYKPEIPGLLVTVFYNGKVWNAKRCLDIPDIAAFILEAC